MIADGAIMLLSSLLTKNSTNIITRPIPAYGNDFTTHFRSGSLPRTNTHCANSTVDSAASTEMPAPNAPKGGKRKIQSIKLTAAPQHTEITN